MSSNDLHDWDINDTGAYNPNNLRWNFTKEKYPTDSGVNSNIVERKIFSNTKITDPISGEDFYGTTEVTQYITEQTLYIEQVFTRRQYAVPDKLYKFKRIGYAKDQSINPFTGVTSATITWRPWVPIEYPKTSFASALVSG